MGQLSGFQSFSQTWQAPATVPIYTINSVVRSGTSIEQQYNSTDWKLGLNQYDTEPTTLVSSQHNTAKAGQHQSMTITFNPTGTYNKIYNAASLTSDVSVSGEEPLLPLSGMSSSTYYTRYASQYASSTGETINRNVANTSTNRGTITLGSKYRVYTFTMISGVPSINNNFVASFYIVDNPLSGTTITRNSDGGSKISKNTSIGRDCNLYLDSSTTSIGNIYTDDVTISSSNYSKWIYVGCPNVVENPSIDESNYIWNTRFRILKSTLGTPRFTLTSNSRVMSISSVTGAGSYSIYADGKHIITTTRNSYTIPVGDYYGSHTFLVQANPSSTLYFDKTSTNSKIATISTNSLTTVGQYVPIQHSITYRYYTASTYSATINNIVGTPTGLTLTKTGINSFTASWDSSGDNITYQYNIDNSTWQDTTSTSVTFHRYSSGSHSVYLRAYYTGDTTSTKASLSDLTSASITLDVLDAATSFDFTRDTVDGGTLSWEFPYADDENTQFYITVNGTSEYYTNNTTLSVTGLKQGTNTFMVRQEFIPDLGYNSANKIVQYVMSKLKTPTINVTENRGIVYNEPGNADSGIATENGIIGLKFTFPNTNIYNNGTATGISWRVYDITYDSSGNEIADSTPIDLASNSFTVNWNDRGSGTIYNDWGYAGKHSIKVQAIYTSNTDFNSDISDSYDYEVNTITPPNISWKSSSTGLDSNQSTLTWYPCTDTNCDFYIVYIIGGTSTGTSNAIGNITRILQPEDISNKIEYRVADPEYAASEYDINDMSIYNGLITNKPESTTEYTVCVVASSYSPWYTATSTASTATYTITVLDAPTNVYWDNNTYTLSWSAVTDPNPQDNSKIYYWIYDNTSNGDERIPDPTDSSIKLQTDQTSVQFESGYFDSYQSDSNIHVLRVSAVKITQEE